MSPATDAPLARGLSCTIFHVASPRCSSVGLTFGQGHCGVSLITTTAHHHQSYFPPVAQTLQTEERDMSSPSGGEIGLEPKDGSITTAVFVELDHAASLLKTHQSFLLHQKSHGTLCVACKRCMTRPLLTTSTFFPATLPSPTLHHHPSFSVPQRHQSVSSANL